MNILLFAEIFFICSFTLLIAFKLIFKYKSISFKLWVVICLLTGMFQLIISPLFIEDLLIQYQLGFTSINPSNIRPMIIQDDLLLLTCIYAVPIWFLLAFLFKYIDSIISFENFNDFNLPNSFVLYYSYLCIMYVLLTVFTFEFLNYIQSALASILTYYFSRYIFYNNKSNINYLNIISILWVVSLIFTILISKSRGIVMLSFLVPLITLSYIFSVIKNKKTIFLNMVIIFLFLVLFLTFAKFGIFTTDSFELIETFDNVTDNILSRLNNSSTIYLYLFDNSIPLSSNQSATQQLIIGIIPFLRSIIGNDSTDLENNLFSIITDGATGGWAITPLVNNLSFFNSIFYAYVDIAIFFTLIGFSFKIFSKVLLRDKIILVPFLILFSILESIQFEINLLFRQLFLLILFILLLRLLSKQFK